MLHHLGAVAWLDCGEDSVSEVTTDWPSLELSVRQVLEYLGVIANVLPKFIHGKLCELGEDLGHDILPC